MSERAYTLRGGVPPRYSLNTTVEPAEEPITLTEAKVQCEIESAETHWDTYLAGLITCARNSIQSATGRRLVTQTVQYIFDLFPYPTYEIHFPFAPIQSITSVQYLDPNGALTTFGATKWVADIYSFRPKVYLAWAQIWPMQRYIQNGVVITAVAGYGLPSTSTPKDVPQNYKACVKMLVAHWFQNRVPITKDSSIQELPYHLKQLIVENRLSCL